MKKILTVLTIVVITCTFSAGAFAAPQNQDMGKGLRKDAPPACMKLTDDQQKQLEDLHQKFIDNTYEMRVGIMNLDQQIGMYMETSNPDLEKLKGMITKKADLAKDLAVKRMEFALEARKISPDLKYMPMGMGQGFGGPGMGHGPGHQGFGRAAAFDCPRMMVDNHQGPEDNTPPEHN